ncbi:divalent-cation tolerance protein CutA [Candidatus Woesearchaeota archaeon]|nr:MAG: divalent-cation tolerance protein CutA [Candidatus Woesearchaeota archaeon]
MVAITDKLAIIYVPCASNEEAKSIASKLVREKLAACVNIYQTTSMYIWKGEMEAQPESVMFVKTSTSKVQSAIKRIKELHSYDVPAILSWEVQSHNRDYSDWAENQLK